MSRVLQSRQPRNGSGRQSPGRDRDPDEASADRETGRNDEGVHGAHKRRDDRDDGDGDDRNDRDDDHDYDESREVLTGDRPSRLPTRDDRDDDDLEPTDDDPDIMEVLDLDDLNQMDGPDA